MKKLVSPYLTAVLFVLMAAYLIQGKYFGGQLDPRLMLAFAGLLVFQSIFVFIVKLRRLKRPGGDYLPSMASEYGVPFPGQSVQVMKILADAGFAPLPGDSHTSYLCYGKRVRETLFIELVACCALLLTLICGTLNFGLGIRGYLMAAPGPNWIEMASNLQKLQQGFMADNSALAVKIRVKTLTNADYEKKGEISFAIADEAGNNKGSHTLKFGEAVDSGKLRLRYVGDTYMVFSYVTRNGLDFQSEPVYLRPDGKRRVYLAALKVNQPGVTGEIIYQPESTGFRLLLRENGKPGFNGRLRQGEVVRGDGYAVQITGLGHFGRIDVMRHNYRNLIFTGLIMLAAALLVRLFCRPLRIWLWSENGSTVFYTKSRWLHRTLTEFDGD